MTAAQQAAEVRECDVAEEARRAYAAMVSSILDGYPEWERQQRKPSPNLSGWPFATNGNSGLNAESPGPPKRTGATAINDIGGARDRCTD